MAAAIFSHIFSVLSSKKDPASSGETKCTTGVVTTWSKCWHWALSADLMDISGQQQVVPFLLNTVIYTQNGGNWRAMSLAVNKHAETHTLCAWLGAALPQPLEQKEGEMVRGCSLRCSAGVCPRLAPVWGG